MRPYQNYLCFLITKNLSYEEVLEDLEYNNLHKIDEPLYEKLHDEVHGRLSKPISNQIIEKKYDSNFLKWMNYLGLGGLWYLEKKFISPETARLRIVYDINQDPIMRLAINSLLIKQVPVTDLIQDINLKYSYGLKEDYIALYKMFFFNPSLMSRKSWKSFLYVCNNTERSCYFTALTESIEVVKTGLDLPVNVDLSKTLQSLLQTSAIKARHYLKFNDNNSNREARQWIATTLGIAAQYHKYSKADIGDFAKSIQMEFDFIETNFPTPDQQVLLDISKKNSTEKLPEGSEESEG
jgi:hypothetical protein